MILLIGGGSRSGKSRFALEQARLRERPLAFIATAEARDEEMRERVRMHQAERGEEFSTIEEPLELGAAISEAAVWHRAIVVDCLTLWLSNLLFADPPRDITAETASMLRIAAESPAAVVLVTNEVGCGIVPDNAISRRFRDVAGSLNQQAAGAATG